VSNHPRRRPRGGLRLPRSVWPIKVAIAATVGQDDAKVAEAVAAAKSRLESSLAGARRRSEVRAVAIDADDLDAALDDLGQDPDAFADVRAFCAAHPGGRAVLAFADYEPDTRRTTIL
jgi:hypothetical protein